MKLKLHSFTAKFTLPGILLFLFSFWLLPAETYAQCTPDPSCVDTEQPGQICPEVLPNGLLNTYYEQVITVIPPDSAEIAGNVIYLSAIQLSYINNLPPGLNYEANVANSIFPVGDSYCVKVSGTPTQAGNFQLAIGVIPHIGGVPFAIGLTEDTTLSIQIDETMSVANLTKPGERFRVSPNPFTDFVQLQHIPTSQSDWTFEVYNAIGQCMLTKRIPAGQTQATVQMDNGLQKQQFLFYRLKSESTQYSGKLMRR